MNGVTKTRSKFAVVLMSVVFGGGCHDVVPRDLGATCSVNDDCLSNICAGRTCLSADGDADNDGLTTAQELAVGSNPVSSDSDGDGLADSDEWGGGVDTDADGLPDIVESAVADGDNDCLADQFDADDNVAEVDTARLAAVGCRRDGVCADGGVVAVCEQGVVNGETVATLRCDYEDVLMWEAGDEVSCDGLDNDCDGGVDEGLGYQPAVGDSLGLGEACSGVGACATLTGVVECGAGGGVVCSVNAGGSAYGGTDELACDGVDNDCDGQVDVGVAWTDPTGEAIGLGEACIAAGECGLTEGVVECGDDGVARCSTEPGGSADGSGAERCDGVDNNCDGAIDEGVTWESGTGALLALGETCGVGVCAGGVVVCGTNGQAICSTQTTSSSESCNGLDDDCDGEVDEVDGLVLACPTQGVCSELELVSATCGPEGLICEFVGPLAYEALVELSCNGLDDDCDGETDEELSANGLPVGAACEGQGVCSGGSGEMVCDPRVAQGLSPTAAVCSADLVGSPEECDGLDNDCDGEVDEADLESDAAMACSDLGVCAAYTAQAPVCGADGWECAYLSEPSFELVELSCDGVDNDCDGVIDEETPHVVTGAVAALAQGQPSSRLDWHVVPAGEAMISVGGLHHSESGGLISLEDVWRFEDGEWTRWPSLPGGARSGRAAAWHDGLGVLVVHGGTSAAVTPEEAWAVTGATGGMWVLTPGAQQWVKVTEINGPGATSGLMRHHHALAVDGGGDLVVSGGVDELGDAGAWRGQLSAQVDADGVKTWSCGWSPIADGPAPRVGATMAIEPSADVALLVGGTSLEGEPVLTAELSFLTGSGSWEVVAGPGGPDTNVLGTRPFVMWNGSTAWLSSDSGVWSFALSGEWMPFEEAGAVIGLWGDGSDRIWGGGKRVGGGLIEPRSAVVWDPAGAMTEPVEWARPAPRVGATLVTRPDGLTWLIGGHSTEAGYPRQDVWSRAVSGEWTLEVAGLGLSQLGANSAVPALRNAAGLWDAVAGRVLLVGGETPEGPSSALWSYDPVSKAFAIVATQGAVPSEVSGRSVFGARPDGQMAYLFGKAPGGERLYGLDLESLVWELLWSGGTGTSGGPPSLPRWIGGASNDGLRVVGWDPDGGVEGWSWDYTTGVWAKIIDSPTSPFNGGVGGFVHDVGGDGTFVIINSLIGVPRAVFFNYQTGLFSDFAVQGFGAGVVGVGLSIVPELGILAVGGRSRGGLVSGGQAVFERACTVP